MDGKIIRIHKTRELQGITLATFSFSVDSILFLPSTHILQTGLDEHLIREGYDLNIYTINPFHE